MAAAMNETREGLKVLTLDGEADIRVGVLSALFSLLRVMRRVAYDRPDLAASDNKTISLSSIPEALPCKCFQLIVGSGDGGWVAIMLGRLGMSTTQAIASYLQIRSSVHDSYPYNGPFDLWKRGSKAAIFEALLQQLVMTQVQNGNAQEMLQVVNPSCRVVALAMRCENDAAHPAIFRNYIARESSLENCPIWFAMRAVASSTIFPAAQLNPMAGKFLAASKLNFNNPVNEAIDEAIRIAESLRITCPPLVCLASLGAGHPGVEPLDESDLAKTTIRLTQDANKAHEQALGVLKKAPSLISASYARLNVDQGLQKELLGGIVQCAIISHTEMYLSRIEVDESIERIVGSLVGQTDSPVSLQSEDTLRQGMAVQPNSHLTVHIQDPTPMSVLIKTYTTELYKLEFGLPLWNPQPVQKVVEIGDLGFINQNGSFETLFNIIVDADKQQQYTCPPGFTPFSVPNKNIIIQERSISTPVLHSGDVTLKVVEDSSQLSAFSL
ncbi:hypothetical protein DL96DRAFT_805716 [Flagelloscypha sp. PMI_526]|nr:hypothetical protein DL96DRAFT_805716 [Flagelloscypha sp. PMI_526]